jgi:glyoxylase-like metal-dependent hydrolase (beta-lactamase superfamily II)
MKSLFTAIATFVMISSYATIQKKSVKTNKLSVEVFKGKSASVNSYLFSNGKSLLVMDVLRSSEDAKLLVELIKSKKLPLNQILITHGHPDHYTGIDLLHNEFPKAKIVVASQEIKNDIKGFSTWMESVGWLDKEPALKPKSDKNPNGFDYDNLISVLKSNKIELNGGGVLDLETAYNPAEAEHLTTVFSKDLNAFFTSDFCYNNVHPWLGTGVDDLHIQNWKKQLQLFKAKFAKTNLVVYPGHGEKSTIKLFDIVEKYILDFEKVTSNAKTKKEAMAKMQEIHPTWEQADFLLLYSVDFHVKE